MSEWTSSTRLEGKPSRFIYAYSYVCTEVVSTDLFIVNNWAMHKKENYPLYLYAFVYVCTVLPQHSAHLDFSPPPILGN